MGRRLYLTVFESSTPLSKSYRYDEATGTIEKRASAQMSDGWATRRFIECGPFCTRALEILGQRLDGLSHLQAIGLGVMRDGVRRTPITTLGRLARMSGDSASSTLARSLQHFTFTAGPGLVLIDNDGGTGTMERLADICSPLRGMASLTRAAMSASIIHPGTGLTMPSAGEHVYAVIDDQRRTKEVLTLLHRACFAFGHGRIDLSKAGSFLQRSAVDVSVGSPERLIFEGRPMAEAPLVVRERPISLVAGTMLDADELAAWAEANHIERRYRDAVHALESDPELIERRRAVQAAHADELEERHRQAGMPSSEARRRARSTVQALSRTSLKTGVICLDPDDVFVTGDHSGVSYRTMLADPASWHGTIGFDPEEGEAYGHTTAIVYRGDHGGLVIHSQAHGGRTFMVDPPLSDVQLKALKDIRRAHARAVREGGHGLAALLQAVRAKPAALTRTIADRLVLTALKSGLPRTACVHVACASGCGADDARALVERLARRATIPRSLGEAHHETTG
ncbi:hypothetical protein [Microvirga sesbaniae]|uniref:hypothetical protein n=1 Tax=Microvirga sesbaniae TaxID=681392 RepID=UPI0021C6036C|nr:hypothetical protein [Microvirga sp. HBU67692]